jgi:hypothetical protein
LKSCATPPASRKDRLHALRLAKLLLEAAVRKAVERHADRPGDRTPLVDDRRVLHLERHRPDRHAVGEGFPTRARFI